MAAVVQAAAHAGHKQNAGGAADREGAGDLLQCSPEAVRFRTDGRDIGGDPEDLRHVEIEVGHQLIPGDRRRGDEPGAAP